MTRSRPESTSNARSRLARSSSNSSPASLRADVVGERLRLLVAVAGELGVEREQVVGLPELLRFEDVFFRRSRGVRRARPRSASCAELDRELLDRAVDREVELLQPARHLDRPALVAKVALDLADDRRRRIGRELDAAFEIEAVDRLEQADRADLHEIVERLAAVRELHREIAHEIEVRDDELVAQPFVLGRTGRVAPGVSLGMRAQHRKASERVPSAAARIPAFFAQRGTDLHSSRVTRLIMTSCVPVAGRSCSPRCPSARE